MLDRIRENGVVGAGGAGFPTAVKLRAQAEVFIVNAAECEPLLHKDKELLLHEPEPFFAGLERAAGLVGARRIVIGVKDKYTGVIAALRDRAPTGIEIFPLRDVYPAGDEFILVHDVTGRVIPPGGLPLDVGCVVNNVETLVNIGLDRPVTHKYLTVGGAVAAPVTLRVPVGTPFADLIEAAGGATTEGPYRVLANGAMMGRLVEDLSEPVTKTTGGLIVLPEDHLLVARYTRTPRAVRRIGRSACDQCSFCTELCPRYLLGHPIEPHLAMRSLGFAPDKDRMIAGTLYCCECNLCSLYACPEDLDPRDVCADAKPLARERGLEWRGDPDTIRPHPVAEGRRVPTRRLMRKLGLSEFRNVGPLEERPISATRLRLPLRQHIGAPAEPCVTIGETVAAGARVAAPPDGALGAPIHSPLAGRVVAVDEAIEIEVAPAAPDGKTPF